MHTLGIIAEYNPFHRGHQFQIKKSKEISGADTVIVVMSGSFVQRGEPAIIDKWSRAKMALLNGADLVLELPVLYATSSAEYFAHSAVKLLNDTGIVDILSFGSETGEIEPLNAIAQLLVHESGEFSTHLKEQLATGQSFAAARASALKQALPAYQELSAFPNNILAIEYLKALNRIQSPMKPMTILREGGGYHDENLQTRLASASAIRKGILQTGVTSILPQLPENTHETFNKAFQQGFSPITQDSFSGALNYQIRRMASEEIKGILEVSEGLENRIKRCASTCFTATQLAGCIKSKRYSLSKIQRVLLHLLLDIKTADLAYYNQAGYSPYIRVLGFRKSRQDALKKLSQNCRIPLLTNLKTAPALLDQKGMRLLQMETKATDIYFCHAPRASCRVTNQDYIRPIVIIP